jgi:hypothetical protein
MEFEITYELTTEYRLLMNAKDRSELVGLWKNGEFPYGSGSDWNCESRLVSIKELTKQTKEA